MIVPPASISMGPSLFPHATVKAEPSWTSAHRSTSCTTNDVTGGNSGSPVINREGEIVGLIFDGNIESLVGDVVYQEETNRSVAVATAGMTEALRQLYNAPTLVKELLGR